MVIIDHTAASCLNLYPGCWKQFSHQCADLRRSFQCCCAVDQLFWWRCCADVSELLLEVAQVFPRNLASSHGKTSGLPPVYAVENQTGCFFAWSSGHLWQMMQKGKALSTKLGRASYASWYVWMGHEQLTALAFKHFSEDLCCEEWSSLYFLEQLFQAPLLLQAHTAALKNLSLGFLHSCDSQRHLKIQSWDSCKQLWLPSLLSPHLSLLFPWEKKVVFNSFLWDREGVNFKLLFVLFYFIFWGGGQCKGCFKAQSEGNQGTSGRTIYKYTANTTR